MIKLWLFVLLSLSPLHLFAEYRPCNKIEWVKNSDVNRCKDGSVSFDQPEAPINKGKKSNWNGQCGSVAAANVFHAYCKKFYPVMSMYNNYFTEWINTPGIRPSTLTVGLNEAFDDDKDCLPGVWRYHYTDNRFDFIRILKKHVTNTQDPVGLPSHWIINVDNKKQVSRPAIVLISKDKGNVLHYVTVVHIKGVMTVSDYMSHPESCEVTYNDMGDQHIVSCQDFAGWASQADDGNWTQWLLYKYNYILYRE